MEMTFPHFAPRQDSVGQTGHRTMLAAIIAQQANSQTVRVVRRAELAGGPSGDAAAQRINYFARPGAHNMLVRGAFWRNIEREPTSEQAVYQAGSTNIKVLAVEAIQAGDQLNHAGHGALRKL
jgi:hypothetical protein